MKLHKVKRKNPEWFPKYFKIICLDCGVEDCWAFSKILTIPVAQSRVELTFRVGVAGACCISSKIRERIISHFARIRSTTGGMWIMMINVAMHSGLLIDSKSSVYEAFVSLREYDVALGQIPDMGSHFSTNHTETFVAEMSPLFLARQCKHSSNTLISFGLDLVRPSVISIETWWPQPPLLLFGAKKLSGALPSKLGWIATFFCGTVCFGLRISPTWATGPWLGAPCILWRFQDGQRMDRLCSSTEALHSLLTGCHNLLANTSWPGLSNSCQRSTRSWSLHPWLIQGSRKLQRL